MSNNLLESLKEHLSGDVVSNLASLLGDSPKTTESALNVALPSLLAGLVEQSGNPQGIGKLFNLLTDGDYNGGILSNLGALSLGGEETTKLISQGANLLSSLFGDKVSGITDLIANASGISKTRSSSLLGFLTPIVLGMIGKHLKIQNIGSAAGLAEFLGSQKGYLQNFIPAGLSGLLSGVGIGESTSDATTTTSSTVDKATSEVSDYLKDKVESVSDTLDNIGDKIEDAVEDTFSSTKSMAEDIGESASQLGSHIVHEGKEYAHSAAEAIEEGAGEGKKFLPWLLIAAALALMWGLLKSCSTPETAPEATAPVTTTAPTTTMPAPEPVTPPPAEEPIAATPAEPQAPAPAEPPKVETPDTVTEPASDAYEKTLSTGYAIKAVKDGFESKLVGYIEGDEAINKDLWFTMDGIQFDTNKATIRAESAPQIEHIAEVLKAYPKVEIKIGGYTDNTGKATANKKLSNNRAMAVKKAIVGKDIKADRIDAEGYGSDHPVASNDTPEGRQQNRRIDVRVTEK
jgi:OmpA-OmpF porin, OOP family